MITYNYKINMTPSGPPLSVPINQYDENFQIVFELISSVGEMVIESGTTATIRGTKSDGNVFSKEAVLEDGYVTVEGEKQMTASPGRNVYELTLYKNGKELNTANFILDVERAAMQPGETQSDSKVYELADVIMRAESIIDAADSIEGSVDAAAGSAQTASEAVETIRGYASAAVEAKDDASGYAVNASESASNAGTAATNAKASEEAAAGHAAAAETAADTATKTMKSLYLDEEGYLCQREVET